MSASMYIRIFYFKRLIGWKRFWVARKPSYSVVERSLWNVMTAYQISFRLNVIADNDISIGIDIGVGINIHIVIANNYSIDEAATTTAAAVIIYPRKLFSNLAKHWQDVRSPLDTTFKGARLSFLLWHVVLWECALKYISKLTQ